MELDHTFTVPVSIDKAWEALLDFERVAPCLPGATLEGMNGDVLNGAVKVKLGPVLLNYQGAATILQRDPATRTMVMDGRAKDSKGNGTAAAKITAHLEHLEPNVTEVHVRTELDVTGRPAQFGRGLMQDVSNKIVGQFADRLATELTNPDGKAPSQHPGKVAPHVVANEPLDLGSAIPRPTISQVIAAAALLVATVLGIRWLRHR